ncbi:MAG: endosialidase [Tyzzerella sp.]|uniref:Endosialidase n=1 Tax=Candidatus Fimicola merdigallinarum TaxID=2840819 RepID=A0A9D9DXG2_9FIRM|nr:endosialidase [Candidatus Fimicola merdigallinarum]
MAVIEELIRLEDNGTISFGNYLMDTKKKVLDFEVENDLYKVKTFKEITKLEKNGQLLLEAVPGATIHNFSTTDRGASFVVEALEDIQLLMELEPETDYRLVVDDVNMGDVKSSMSGKINFSVEVKNAPVNVKLERI